MKRFVTPSTTFVGSLLLGFLLSLVGCSQPAPAPAPAPAKPTVAATASAAAATNQNLWETNSVFEVDPKNCRDPFFPNSSRFAAAPVQAAGPAPKLGAPLLNLRGISGPVGHRLALINTQTFAVGEDAYVRGPEGQVLVRCLEINEQSVKVLVGKDPVPKELRINSSH